jgi:flagellar motor switch protein FliN/FliY
MGEEKQNSGQDEIDALVKQAPQDPPESSLAPPSGGSPAGASAGQGQTGGNLGQQAAGSFAGAPRAGQPERGGGDVEYLLRQAQEALASVDQPSGAVEPAIAPFRLRDFAGSPATTDKASIELIREVELDVKIELGRTHMHLEDVLMLRKGSVVPLDKLAGDPVDIYVNGRLIARGEVLVLNDNFCVRVAELIAGDATP